MTETAAPVPADPGVPSDPAKTGADAPAGYGLRLTQVLVLLAAAGCFALFWWAGERLHVPAHAGYEASLLQQPGAGGVVVAVGVAALLVVACAVLGHLVAGRRWALAGPFAAAFGLSALSLRGGPSRFVYFHAVEVGTGKGVYVTLLVELVLLFVPIGALWYWVARRIEAAERAVAPPDAPAARPADWATTLQALAAQVAIVGFATAVFVQSDAKATTLLGLFVAALAGTGLVEYWFKDARLGPWYWVGPLGVGALGYLLCAFTGGTDTLAIGRPGGLLPALARPLPLDYASVGVLGALLGYWTGADHPELSFGLLLMPTGLTRTGYAMATRAAMSGDVVRRDRTAPASSAPGDGRPE